MRQRESLFADKVDRDLKEMGAWFFNVNQVSLRGIPDRVGCLNGMFFALELKTETGRPSKLQQYVVSQIKAAGGFAEIVRPSEWEAVKKELRDHPGNRNRT